MSILLASSSPRRHELLKQVSIPHTVYPAHIDESPLAGESFLDYVRRLASEKAHAVGSLFPHASILGADTTVVLDGLLLNKPQGAAAAEAMLRTLSGRTHQVHTGLCFIHRSQIFTHVETTSVTFNVITAPDLERYVASGEPYDKAGAYGIQGFAARWITRIEGDYFNVVGLPLAACVQLLREAGAI